MRNKVDWVGGERQYVGRGVNGVKSVLTKKVKPGEIQTHICQSLR